MKKKNFVLKGNIAYSKDLHTIEYLPKGYLVCEDGKSAGVFSDLPEKYQDFELIYCKDRLIIPGMTDLHVHAPQYTFRGLGMDLELLEWLNTHTFPEEAKYADIDYAKQAYSYFVEDLKNSFTTRAVVFATLHRPATVELMDQLEKSGIVSYVGKVNMDRNGGENLCEESPELSAQETLAWLEDIDGKYERTMPILTPRFIPSCSDSLMEKLSHIRQDKNLKIQSHLSENQSEIAWVKELVPDSTCYGDAYAKCDMIGDIEHPAIMAHCVYSGEEEQKLLKEKGVYVAHCPECNMNVSSGIAPVREFLDKGIHVGIGTDVAGGSNLSMLGAMAMAVRASKMYWRLVDQKAKPLSFEEVFYMATLGGGSYFGKVGSFQEGYEFDALVVDDSSLKSMRELTLAERLERMIYQDRDIRIDRKYVRGQLILD